MPYLTGFPIRAESAAPGSIAGINSFLTQITSSVTQDQQASLMEDAFVRVAREEFEWKRVEPRNGYYDWTRFDAAVEIARSHNISLLGKLVYTAPWASSAPAGTAASAVEYYPPRSNADYAAYAKAVVHRYKDRVHVWEIWNEEDSSLFWKPAPSGTAYAALLKAAYAAIKSEDPTATVVLGGTVGFDVPFMDQIRSAGAWSSFDALGLHDYVGSAPEIGESRNWLDKAAAYTERYGNKPIWITELGWSTYTGSIGVSEATQASYLERAYLDAASRGVAGIFWFELMEASTSSTSLNGHYGLVTLDGRLKPGYDALRQVAGALDQTVSIGSVNPSVTGTAGIADTGNRVSSWSAGSIGTGSARLSTSTFARSGSQAVRVDYSFPGPSDGVELRPSVKLSGSPSAVSVWVYGDDSADPIYMRFVDASGESFQALAGNVTTKSWKRLTMWTDGGSANWTHWGGNNNGVIDYPITLASLYVYRGPFGVSSGTIYLDDITTHYGPNVRGVNLAGGTWNIQALYSLGAHSVRVAVPDASANLLSGASNSALTVSGGAVSVTLSPTVTFIGCHLGVAPASFTPNHDGVNDTVTISWVTGDNARATLDVYNGSGRWLRTIYSGRSDANMIRAVWDGTYTDTGGTHTIGTGRYQFKLVETGLDGRQSALWRSASVP